MDKDCNDDYNDGKDNDEDLLDQIRRIYYADVIKGGELSALDVKRTYALLLKWDEHVFLMKWGSHSPIDPPMSNHKHGTDIASY